MFSKSDTFKVVYEAFLGFGQPFNLFWLSVEIVMNAQILPFTVHLQHVGCNPSWKFFSCKVRNIDTAGMIRLVWKISTLKSFTFLYPCLFTSLLTAKSLWQDWEGQHIQLLNVQATTNIIILIFVVGQKHSWETFSNFLFHH